MKNSSLLFPFCERGILRRSRGSGCAFLHPELRSCVFSNDISNDVLSFQAKDLEEIQPPGMGSTATYDRDVLEEKLDDPTAQPFYLPLQFLKDITCNFSEEQELGSGGYGVVYKGVLQSGKIIAVKKIFDMHLLEDGHFQREVSYLMGMKHQNIVQLVGYCAESRWEAIKLPSGKHIMAELPTRLLCFEYLRNNSLDKYFSDESSGLDWYKRFEIIKGICSGLHFLHENHIVHLDLKPQNILMDATMMPKVADFGLSRLLCTGKSRTTVSGIPAGSRGYMAPEYSVQGIISSKADIFSFGVIITEIIAGGRDYPLVCSVPDLQKFSGHESIQQYIESVLGRWRNIFQKEPKYTSVEICTKQVKECITIALRCVDHDKSRRPNAWEIFQMLSAVESMERRTEYFKDSVVHQVQEEVQAGLVRSPTNMERQPTLKLAWKTPLANVTCEGQEIVDITGSPPEIILVDVDTGLPVALRQALRLELVLLDAEFPPDGREDWSHEEFQKNIVKEPEGTPPLVTRDVSLTMRDGRAVVGLLKYTDNSFWWGHRMFRIGARVVPGTFEGPRVQELITEPFVPIFPDALKEYL